MDGACAWGASMGGADNGGEGARVVRAADGERARVPRERERVVPRVRVLEPTPVADQLSYRESEAIYPTAETPN